MSRQGRRAAAGAAALAVAVIAAVCVDRAVEAARPSAAEEAVRLAADPSAAGAYAASSGDAQLSGFEREVLPLAGRDGVRAAEEGTLVGFSSATGAEATFADVSAALAERGWTAVSSGSACAGSFVKADGSFRWAFVTCAQVGEGSSVVVRCAPAPGSDAE